MACSITYLHVWQLKLVVSSIHAPTDRHKKWGSTSMCGPRSWKSGVNWPPGPRGSAAPVTNIIFNAIARTMWSQCHNARLSQTNRPQTQGVPMARDDYVIARLKVSPCLQINRKYDKFAASAGCANGKSSASGASKWTIFLTVSRWLLRHSGHRTS